MGHVDRCSNLLLRPFPDYENVIEILNPDNATGIAFAKLLYSDCKIEGQLAFMKANFNCLMQGIARIQEKGASLESSLALL
jgi:hypothetical protein